MDEWTCHLASFPEQNPNPVVEADLDGRVIYANPAALALFPDLTAKGPRHPFLAGIEALGAQIREQRATSIRRDVPCGDTVFHQAVYYVAESQAVRLYCLDVTERKRVEQALRESEQRYRNLFAAMTEGFALCEIVCNERGDPCDYRFLDVNVAFERQTGLTRREVIGKLISEVLPSIEPYWVEIYGRVALTGEPVRFESFASPLARHYEVAAYCPAPGQFAAVFSDITERRRAEEEIRRLNADLERRVQERTAELENANKEYERVHGLLRRQHASLRAMAARVAEVAEAERRQLARELHDRVGQDLAAVSVNLKVIGDLIAVQPAERLTARIDDALSLLETVATHVQDVSVDLRPPVLDDYGLVAALRWHARQLSRRGGVRITVTGEELPKRLPPSVEMGLFRIAQEALTNVIRHAAASQVVVALTESTDGARLVISDDGKGFDPHAAQGPDTRQHLGLVIMNERALGIGAELCVASEPGKGTTVIVEIQR